MINSISIIFNLTAWKNPFFIPRIDDEIYNSAIIIYFYPMRLRIGSANKNLIRALRKIP